MLPDGSSAAAWRSTSLRRASRRTRVACRRPGSATRATPRGDGRGEQVEDGARFAPRRERPRPERHRTPTDPVGRAAPASPGARSRPAGGSPLAFTVDERESLGSPVRREHVGARERRRERRQREPAAELEHARPGEVECRRRSRASAMPLGHSSAQYGRNSSSSKRSSSIRLSGSSGRSEHELVPADHDAFLSHPASLPPR